MSEVVKETAHTALYRIGESRTVLALEIAGNPYDSAGTDLKGIKSLIGSVDDLIGELQAQKREMEGWL